MHKIEIFNLFPFLTSKGKLGIENEEYMSMDVDQQTKERSLDLIPAKPSGFESDNPFILYDIFILLRSLFISIFEKRCEGGKEERVFDLSPNGVDLTMHRSTLKRPT